MFFGVGIFSMIGVFLLDMLTPPGVAISHLFLVPVLVGLWIPDRRYIHFSAATSSILIFAGYFLSHQSSELWPGFANRILSLALIWFSAWVCLTQKKAQASQERKSSFMRLLRSVAISANEADGVTSALEMCLKNICLLTGWPVGHAFLLNDQNVLVSSKAWYLDEPGRFADFVKITEKASRAPGDGMPGRVLQSGKPSWSMDVTQDPNCPRASVAQLSEVKGGYSFPILIKDKVVGVLEFFSAKVAEPDEVLLEVMANIGVQLGRVVERDLVAKIEEEARKDLEKRVADRTAELSRTNQELQKEMLAHKQAEEMAEHLKRQSELILTSAGEGIFGLDLQGNFTFVNPAAAHLFGYSIEWMIGRPVGIVLNSPGNEKSEFPKMSPIYSALKDCISYRETDEDFWRKDGKSFPAEYTCTSSMEDGKIVGAVITFKNIAERKFAEQQREKLVQHLEHANNELGEFAYVVSHDLKEPVRGVSSLAQWISEDYADKFDESGRAQMKLLIDNTLRMHRLIDGILDYCKIGREKIKITRLDLSDVVRGVINALRIPENIRVYAEGELPVVVFFQLHLEQVIQNLIGNAIKHLGKPNGEVAVSCRDAGEVWELCVRDNGVGIEERHFDRIFKLFQVLKKQENYSDSTGIGLALVKKIADIHNEEVWLESEVGKGTSFYFTITKRFEEGG